MRTPPRRPFNEQIRRLTTEVGIDYNSRGWRQYLFKRWKDTKGHPTNGQLGDLVNVLNDVKNGKLKFVMTPDGIITALPY